MSTWLLPLRNCLSIRRTDGFWKTQWYWMHLSGCFFCCCFLFLNFTYAAMHLRRGAVVKVYTWAAHSRTQLGQVAYCKAPLRASLQPRGLRGHEKCWLNLFFVPTLLLRVKAGSVKKKRKKKEPLFLPQRREQKGLGLAKEYTPPAIKSLGLVLWAQNPSASAERRGNVKIRWEALRGN